MPQQRRREGECILRFFGGLAARPIGDFVDQEHADWSQECLCSKDFREVHEKANGMR
jgi:hypothetical protein